MSLGLDPEKMHAILAYLPLLVMVLSQRVLGLEVMTRMLVLVLINQMIQGKLLALMLLPPPERLIPILVLPLE